MRRSLLLTMLVLALSTVQAQTMFHISNVTVTEKGEARRGRDVSATAKGVEGNDRLVMYEQDGMLMEAHVRMRTHDVSRSSLKDGAVYVTLEIRLKVDGEDDGRVVQKVFYAEQERRTHISEKFTIKKGMNVRVITLDFDGSLD